MRVFACIAIQCVFAAAHAAAPPESWLITADKIYTAPDAAPLANGAVLLRNGLIASVADERSRIALPEDTKTSECRGVVVAGFQNSHVHFMEPPFSQAATRPAAELGRALEEMLTRWGFTSAFDTTSDQANTVALRKRVESGELRGPRIRTSGYGFFPVDGIPFYAKDIPAELIARMHQPRSPEEARAAVRANLANGADATKLFLVTSPDGRSLKPMSVDIAKGAVEETHAHGKLALAHPTNLEGVRIALAAGVDVLVHTTLDDKAPWDEATVRKMVRQHVSVMPTFQLWYDELRRDKVPEPVVESMVGRTFEQLRAFKAADGQVLFGTDVGYTHLYDPTDEYMLMSKAGLGAMDILASLTTAPAERWNESKHRGRVQPGMAADLVVLAADPAEDVANFARVRCTFRNGKLIYRAP